MHAHRTLRAVGLGLLLAAIPLAGCGPIVFSDASALAITGSGPPPEAAQDSFMYRTEHGVASIMLDDDNCDCETSLQMGHGMCYGGWGTGSSPENSFGVDRLYNAGAENGPRPEYHLELYWR